MRRIAFRAYDLVEKKMIYAKTFCIPTKWRRNLKCYCIMEDTSENDVENFPIFEKDIVKARYIETPGVIHLIKNCWRICFANNEDELLGNFAATDEDIRILGNFYEHPDLLSPPNQKPL